MPSIEQSLASKNNTEGLVHINPVDIPTRNPMVHAAQNNSQANPFLRCPVPPIRIPSVDNLQLYDRGGFISQYRIWGA